MSSANLVPETYELTGDDAWSVLRHTNRRSLLVDAYKRLRVADGFSHARSLAFMMALVIVQAVIGLVGLAELFHGSSVSSIIFAAVRRALPGPAGRSITAVVVHAHASASQHRYAPIVLGLLGALFTGTAAMGQLERGLNRIYGIEQDRPTLQKYGRALAFAASVGVLTLCSLACLAFGHGLFASSGSSDGSITWAILRWPLGLGLIAIAVTVLFRWAPKRRQPMVSWLAFGAGVSVALWGASSAILGLFFRLSATFGQTYGPLAGTVALLFWCFFSSVALFYGAAATAQLEAVRAGSRAPQDAEKARSTPSGRVGITVGATA